MAVKAIVTQIKSGNNGILFYVDYYNSPDITSSDGNWHQIYYSDFNSIDITTMKAAMDAETISYIFGVFGWVITASDITYYDPTFTQPDKLVAATAARVVTDGVSHSFVTTAAAANGFQISSTRDALVNYSVTVSSAVQIGLITNVTGYCVLEVAATNSTTAGDWKEKGRVGTGQNVGLALAFSSTQTATAPLFAMVPAGYYARLRTVNSNGTPTYTYISGTEVLV